jgi:hypothetical protein
MKDARMAVIGARLMVSANVRYWEDATVNGVEDTEGALIPFRTAGLWVPTIDMDAGRVINWPQGTTADIHYKVCDAGEYRIKCADGRVLKYNGDYVPDGLLCMGDRGYGDYIILKINEDGIIQDWQPTVDLSDWAVEG